MTMNSAIWYFAMGNGLMASCPDTSVVKLRLMYLCSWLLYKIDPWCKCATCLCIYIDRNMPSSIIACDIEGRCTFLIEQMIHVTMIQVKPTFASCVTFLATTITTTDDGVNSSR